MVSLSDPNLMHYANLNSLKFFAPIAVAGVTTYLINEIGHSILKCEEGSNASKAVKLVSFTSAAALGIYTSSFIPVQAFTWQAALLVAGSYLLVIVIVSLVINIFDIDIGTHGKFYLPGFEGAIVGLLGPYFTAAAVVAAAATTAILY